MSIALLHYNPIWLNCNDMPMSIRRLLMGYVRLGFILTMGWPSIMLLAERLIEIKRVACSFLLSAFCTVERHESAARPSTVALSPCAKVCSSIPYNVCPPAISHQRSFIFLPKFTSTNLQLTTHQSHHRHRRRYLEESKRCNQ